MRRRYLKLAARFALAPLALPALIVCYAIVALAVPAAALSIWLEDVYG